MNTNKIKRIPKVVFREEEDMGLLFNPETGKMNILNETAKFIWNLLDGKTTKDQIVTCVVEDFEDAEKDKVSKDYDQYVSSLRRLGFVEFIEEIPPLPGSICFGITSKCNFSCKHCLNRNQPGSEPDMTTEKILEVIDELGKGGARGMSLFGGEPLCHPDFRRIVEHINRYPIDISLNTNGSLIDDETARWMKEHRITGAVVSFDGGTAEVMDKMRGKGSFEKSVKGIEALVKTGIPVTLSVTLNKLNYKYVRDMVLLGQKIKGTSIRFNHVFFTGNAACFVDELYLTPEEEREAIDAVWKAKEEFGNFIAGSSSYLCQKTKLEHVKNYKPSDDKITIPACGAAKCKCSIRPDGWVVPCEIIWEVKCDNLKNKSLSEIWLHNDVMNSFRKPLVIDLNEIPECKGCNYQYVCFIGHRCYPYYYPGGVYNRALYCWRKEEKKF